MSAVLAPSRGSTESIRTVLIPCPHCGSRDVSEFTYGGDARQRQLPQPGDTASWLDHLYLRANPRGAHAELWFHAAGCQQWLQLTRDTTDHRIADVVLCSVSPSGGALP